MSWGHGVSPPGAPVLRKPIRVPDLVRQVIHAMQRLAVP